MITIEMRNLFGTWQPVENRQFKTPEAAREFCLRLADATDVAYRVLQDGQVMDEIDLERGFFEFLDNSEGMA